MHETYPSFSFLCAYTTFSCMPRVKQVFGVLDSPEYSGATTGVYRPVIHEGKDEHHKLPGDGSSVDLLHGFIPAAVSAPPTGPMQVTQEKTLEEPWKHVSQCMDTGVYLPFLVSLISSLGWFLVIWVCGSVHHDLCSRFRLRQLISKDLNGSLGGPV
ncbi:hypothetical protein ILYODFUR_023382 [Ilyodon furcidens]|uniref:Uncharacterized protein n=1 Tax=Ilyodon furcidens TaxID=33524 RepID=A0ABV0TX22_9TELE